MTSTIGKASSAPGQTRNIKCAPSDHGVSVGNAANDVGTRGRTKVTQVVDGQAFLEQLWSVPCCRSDSARNLIAHRDGPDGTPWTADDTPFQTAAAVDSVYRVGARSLERLYDCAHAFGDGSDQPWKSAPILYGLTPSDPSSVYSQQDGVIWIDGEGAPVGSELLENFGGHQIGFTRGPRFFGTWGVARQVPEGYGADYLGLRDAVTSFRITRDPPGTLSSVEALQIAREQLVSFLRDDRIHRDDWQAESPKTWEEALARGSMEGINRFGDLDYDEDSTMNRNSDHYEFSGRGPFRLYTNVRVSKVTRQATYFYVEID